MRNKCIQNSTLLSCGLWSQYMTQNIWLNLVYFLLDMAFDLQNNPNPHFTEKYTKACGAGVAMIKSDLTLRLPPKVQPQSLKIALRSCQLLSCALGEQACVCWALSPAISLGLVPKIGA